MLAQICTAVGAVVIVGVATSAAACGAIIAGNIYGGIKGAYRIRAIRLRSGASSTPWGHRATILSGFKAWRGERYRNGYGTYYRAGGMRVPVDGRDPISREHYSG